jgi:hypothetical protein
MDTEILLPPLALALARLRQPRPATPRTWPYAPQTTTMPTAPVTATTNDFLIMVPAAALLADALPPTPERAAAATGQSAARTYWFDL